VLPLTRAVIGRQVFGFGHDDAGGASVSAFSVKGAALMPVMLMSSMYQPSSRLPPKQPPKPNVQC
jgi:hypothetical protein